MFTSLLHSLNKSPVVAEVAGGPSNTPMDTIDIYRTYDADGGSVNTRIVEIEPYSGNSQIASGDIYSTTVYKYSDGTNNSGQVSSDWGTDSALTNGSRTIQDDYDDNGTNNTGQVTVNWMKGGVNPKHLVRMLVPQSQGVDAMVLYFQSDAHVPGVTVEKNGVEVYKNSASPISGHVGTYTSPSNSSTSSTMRYDFGKTVPFSFGSPDETFTASTGSNALATASTANKASVVLRIVGSITQSTTNCLFELGGTGSGLVIYCHNGTLYAQGGDGTVSGGSVELSYAIGASETLTDITVSLSKGDVNSGNCTLFVNLNKVDTATFSGTTTVFGTNVGGPRQRHGSNIAVTRMGGNTADYVLSNGTVTSVEAWGNSYLNNS